MIVSTSVWYGFTLLDVENNRLVDDAALTVENGRTYVPLRQVAEALGGSARWDRYLDGAAVTSAGAGYDASDLYWLSHIIYAESGNQPLEGMIGVGNVVLNRVADPTCPDTIYDVIFDRRYGVQFSPTENGTIYDDPNELSIIAAKLCLEGYEVVGDSLFFVNPQIGISSWFVNTRNYVATIGEHVFFA